MTKKWWNQDDDTEIKAPKTEQRTLGLQMELTKRLWHTQFGELSNNPGDNVVWILEILLWRTRDLRGGHRRGLL